MKEKIAIVACSNCGAAYIPEIKDLERYKSKITMNGKTYIDSVDIEATEFYQILRDNPDLVPTTAQASTGEMIEIFEKLASKGYTDVITITISGRMSGTYSNAVLAGSMVEDKIRVHAIDSKTVTFAQGYFTLRAHQMAEAGASVEEIKKEVERMKKESNTYFAVDTLKYLVKNGRISGASGFVGGLLKIKPLIHIDENGQIYSKEKIRTTKKVHERLVEIMKEEITGKDVEIFIAHADAKDYIDYFKEEFKDYKVNIIPLSPVIGCHVGPDTLGMGYIVK